MQYLEALLRDFHGTTKFLTPSCHTMYTCIHRPCRQNLYIIDITIHSKKITVHEFVPLNSQWRPKDPLSHWQWVSRGLWVLRHRPFPRQKSGTLSHSPKCKRSITYIISLMTLMRKLIWFKGAGWPWPYLLLCLPHWNEDLCQKYIRGKIIL